jgi:hypothetical protein
MKLKALPFRQVHLDFHTSPHIAGIGEKFEKAKWQDTLLTANVNSITLFSKCHHGWSYHPTKVGKMHPHLSFDLLRAQYDACKEVNIAAPIYLSAGVDNVMGVDHPEWREIDEKGTYSGWVKSPLSPGFQMMDFLSPYTDYLCAQIEEVTELFPDCDGIFLDIISQAPGCSKWRMAYLEAHNLDAEKEADRKIAAEAAMLRYYEMTTAAAQRRIPDMPVFHNSGHIPRGERSILKYFSHLELESLPTGGWGYDHFPMSAKYVANLGMDFLGMTGKFHTTWGEFGGLKHPNALRYECAAMLAFNSKCSVGDQLHPSGALDESTYRIIGEAYREVAAREPWCDGVQPVADIAMLSSEAEKRGHRDSPADEGATRALLESHFLFSLVDRTMDFASYKLLILPDDIQVDAELTEKIHAYLHQGGKLLLTGKSGLDETGAFAFDIGAEHFGTSEFSPDFLLPNTDFRAAFMSTPVVAYLPSERIKATTGRSLGAIHDPYFNRTYRHFCSHQHTPFREEPSGFDCGVQLGPITYLAHPVFSLYRSYGAVVYREYIQRVISQILGDGQTVQTNLPSTARISLNRQAGHRRHVLHLLYANTISRGGKVHLSGGNLEASGASIEVIEDLLPLVDTQVALRGLPKIARATLEPSGEEIPLTAADGEVTLSVPRFVCHQIVALHEE